MKKKIYREPLILEDGVYKIKPLMLSEDACTEFLDNNNVTREEFAEKLLEGLNEPEETEL